MFRNGWVFEGRGEGPPGMIMVSIVMVITILIISISILTHIDVTAAMTITAISTVMNPYFSRRGRWVCLFVGILFPKLPTNRFPQRPAPQNGWQWSRNHPEIRLASMKLMENGFGHPFGELLNMDGKLCWHPLGKGQECMGNGFEKVLQ